MAVPKKRKSHSRTRMGRSHDALKPVRYAESKTNGSVHLQHNIDPEGYYNGRQVFFKIDKKKADEVAENSE